MEEEAKKNAKLKTVFKVITIITTILIILFIIFAIKLNIFQDNMVLVKYMKKFGIWGPIIFIFLQAIQVVFPVIPGGASCLAGVLAFGPIGGLIYNYIGLIIGSSIAFFLSRKYGLKFVKKLFKEETVEKYVGYIKTNTFKKIFFWGIVIPGLPDDLLCYVSGLSDMDYKTFLWIIIIGKPPGLLLYSAFMGII